MTIPPFLRSIWSRVLAYAALDDRFFSTFISPAIRSLRVSGGFVRSVLVLLSGSTIAMIVPIAAAPLLTRLYTPHEYGVFALFVSIVTVFSVPTGGNYDVAVMLPEKDEEAFGLVKLCCATALACSLAFLLALFFIPGLAGALFGNTKTEGWLWLAPVTAFLMTAQLAFSNWLNRRKQFRRLASSKVMEAVASPVISLGLGTQGWGVAGLVVGLLWGKIGALWVIGRDFWKKRGEIGPATGKSMGEQARKYADFPLYSAPTSLLDVLALQIPVFFLARFFEPAVVGWFAITTRVIGTPLAIVGSSVSQVYYKWVAEAGRTSGDVRSYTLKVALYLTLIVAGPLLIVAAFSPSVFSLVFGEQWRMAGEYARIMVVPLAVKFIVSPLSVTMPASGNIKLGSLWKMIYFVTSTVVLYIAAHFSPLTFLYVYSGHELVLYGLYFLLILRASAGVRQQGRVRDKSLGRLQ